jgi:hypothetical protein
MHLFTIFLMVKHQGYKIISKISKGKLIDDINLLFRERKYVFYHLYIVFEILKWFEVS